MQEPLMKVTLSRRKVSDVHEVLDACRELARYLYPYPIEGKHHIAWWGLVLDQAGVICDGEDLTLAASLELYAYLLAKVDEVFCEIAALYEQKVRKI